MAGDAPAEPSDELKALLADNAAAPPTYQEVLSLFTSAQRFGLVIRAAEALHLPKRDLVRMTIALLKSGALEQVHTYIHCVAPPPEPPEPLSPSAAADGHDGGPALARWRLFRRLWPLLHGVGRAASLRRYFARRKYFAAVVGAEAPTREFPSQTCGLRRVSRRWLKKSSTAWRN